ncbi:hypothetical protein F5Y15DRAFT_415258 [Xylariaceae sp. FL0016]|nr:hypothetical protein F5Y15DRAFT_415258 [Xylariaceae sp. FL0016]
MPGKKKGGSRVTNLTHRDVEILALGWRCCTVEPVVNYDKLAEIANFKNGNSARACFLPIKKKLMSILEDRPAGGNDDNKAADDSDNAKAKKSVAAKSKRKRAADVEAEDSDAEPEIKKAKAKEEPVAKQSKAKEPKAKGAKTKNEDSDAEGKPKNEKNIDKVKNESPKSKKPTKKELETPEEQDAKIQAEIKALLNKPPVLDDEADADDEFEV